MGAFNSIEFGNGKRGKENRKMKMRLRMKMRTREVDLRREKEFGLAGPGKGFPFELVG